MLNGWNVRTSAWLDGLGSPLTSLLTLAQPDVPTPTNRTTPIIEQRISSRRPSDDIWSRPQGSRFGFLGNPEDAYRPYPSNPLGWFASSGNSARLGSSRQHAPHARVPPDTVGKLGRPLHGEQGEVGGLADFQRPMAL